MLRLSALSQWKMSSRLSRHQDQRVLAGYIRAGRGKDDIAHVL
jgi:hypothetical protein